MNDEAMELLREFIEAVHSHSLFALGDVCDKAEIFLAKSKAASADRPGQITPKEASNGDACGAAPDSGEGMPEIGDYVLATKYQDGDPGDAFGVGFYDREEDGRHYVKDSNGNQIRGNGFRRVEKITSEIGAWILESAREWEDARVVKSVWDYKDLRELIALRAYALSLREREEK